MTMAQMPGVHLEMLHHPTLYTPAQIEFASRCAAALNRGRLVVCEPPRLVPFDDQLND
jgi:hypothetical protein